MLKVHFWMRSESLTTFESLKSKTYGKIADELRAETISAVAVTGDTSVRA